MSVSEDVSSRGDFKVWQCVLCAYVYDEALGDPDGGVAPGTRWEDVPEDWVCPECGARKSEFDMVVVG
ncbi:Rubredoxin domain containing protein [Rhizobium sp. CF080]|uniref:rubredoxin n=1 Tax=Rhizobium sp. (strain CF080) TaxID=1144310 RepID=UPI00027189A7|nr:rubredoxin [Rhizobium sp. CF080]EUB99446.1 Rubredoxin domain containing protein [Rhizobium sp. CF080]